MKWIRFTSAHFLSTSHLLSLKPHNSKSQANLSTHSTNTKRKKKKKKTCSIASFPMATAVPVTCVRLNTTMHTNQIAGKISPLKLVPAGRIKSGFPCLRTSRFQISCAAKAETVNKVCEVVKTQLALASDTVVAPDSKFSALGADSLDTVEIVMTLEEEFGISVEEENSQNITTVQEAADLIEKLVEKKNATA